MLLNQAKKMKMEKIEREKELFLQRNKIQLNKNEIIDKNYSSVNNFKPQKIPNSANQNQNQKNSKEESDKNVNKAEGDKNENNNNNINSRAQTGTVLPAIKSSKNKERIERLKLKNEDDGKMDEINDMMSKIMDEF